MSSSVIPNLNTFRRGRGKARGGLTGSDRKSNDEIVQATDNDAAGSRLSAVDAGYLDDPFAKLLTPSETQRRLPLMNRGTYVRTSGIDTIVETFLASGPGRKQIVSLGAGSDTRYFRLIRNQTNLDLVYHEIDFEANTKIKIKQIESDLFTQKVRQLCLIDTGKFEISNGHLTSPNYYIHGHDLRNMPETLTGLDSSLPTLVISECCLIYLSPEEAEKVLKYFTGMLSEAPLAITIYEPIRPNDSFGKTMVRNLITRGIHLQTLETYAELDHQRQRLRDHGFEQHAEDIEFIWRHWFEETEKQRVDSLEWMDEIEEFVLLAKHYCIAWGWRGWTQDSSWRSLSTSRQ